MLKHLIIAAVLGSPICLFDAAAAPSRVTQVKPATRATARPQAKKVVTAFRQVGKDRWLSTSSGYYVDKPYAVSSLGLGGKVHWAQVKKAGPMGLLKRQAQPYSAEGEHLSNGARAVATAFARTHNVSDLSGTGDHAEVLFSWGIGRYMAFRINVTKNGKLTSVRGTWDTVLRTVEFGDNPRFVEGWMTF
jgi:hypothetical protein